MSNYDEEMQQRAAQGDEEARRRLEENRRFRFPKTGVSNGPYVDDFQDLPEDDKPTGGGT